MLTVKIGPWLLPGPLFFGPTGIPVCGFLEMCFTTKYKLYKNIYKFCPKFQLKFM